METLRAYDEIIDFFAAGTTPENVATFRASEATRERVENLIDREKTTGLSADESKELGKYMDLEHLMRLAKARARRYLSNEPSR